MIKKFEGTLFNRLEKLGEKVFNHVGCKGESDEFIDFLTQFVPEIGMQRKVTFTVEAQEEPEIVEEYKAVQEYKNYKEEYGEKNNN